MATELMNSLQLSETELAEKYTPIKDMPIVAEKTKEMAGTTNNRNEVK